MPNSSRNWKTNDFGVIYVCTTPEYLEMAIESVASLRENEPDVPILLYTGTNVGEEVTFAASKFDFSFQALEAPSFSFLDKIEGMITSPFKKTLYLDSDTIVLGPIVEDFSLLLEKSPLCALPNMHLNLELEEALVGDVFGQFNTGVIGYSRSLEANGADAVGLFFQEWKRIYLDLDGIAPTDQISFRLAVLSADLMCAPITERYNFMGGGSLSDVPKIIHFTRSLRRRYFYRFPWARRVLIRRLRSAVYPSHLLTFGPALSLTGISGRGPSSNPLRWFFGAALIFPLLLEVIFRRFLWAKKW